MAQPVPAPAANDPAASPAAVGLESSCRAPVLFLFVAAAKWLLIASVLGLLASLKCHAPGLLADTAWLTYGRVQPAAQNAFLYGFGIQAGLAAVLWLLVRLGRTPLSFPSLALAGTALWNVGLLIGVLFLLAGDSTGYLWLEMPRAASTLLFIAYAGVGVAALDTFRRRQDAELYPSQWFLLAALFWFPWVYSTANLLVAWFPARGIFPAVVAWWYVGQLTWVWFGFVGLALLFYLVPQLSGRAMFSRYHAMFAFWLLLLFSGWRGIPQGAPVPAWMPGVSTVAAVFSLVPLLAIGLNLHRTLAGGYAAARARWPLNLALLGAAAYGVAMALGILADLPAVAPLVEFTLFVPGLSWLFLYGFFGVTAFAALYTIVPRLLPGLLPSNALVKLHVMGVLAGLLLYALPLLAGGLVQGRALNQGDVAFLETLKPALMAFRIGTLGEVLLLAGHAALVLNFALGILGTCRQCCRPAWSDLTRTEPAEVRP